MSAILSADDLNDFISPGVACIKPVETLPAAPPKDESNPYEVVREDKAPPPDLGPAQISLTDCLACSGCVTSAEAVLVSLQSHNEVLANLDSPAGQQKRFIALVSPQSRASLAATYGVTESEAGWMISQLLCGPSGIRKTREDQPDPKGFDLTLDTNTALSLSHYYAAEELLATLASSPTSIAKSKPILTSSCPGFVCYLESTQPALIPHLSTLKSPQAILGTVVKTLLHKDVGGPAGVYVVGVMPCFDKKLEGARGELTSAVWGTEGTTVRDVDCVITTRELISLAEARGVDFATLPRRPVRGAELVKGNEVLRGWLSGGGRRAAEEEGTSGGYLQYIVQRLLRENPGSKLRVEKGRNVDTVDYVVYKPAEGDTEETVIARLARCYGFRNIQNLVRRLKPANKRVLPRFGKAATPGAGTTGPRRGGAVVAARRGAVEKTGSQGEYVYVEVMACPGGCTNGGGQVKFGDEIVVSSQVAGSQKEWQVKVDEAYYSASEEDGEEQRRVVETEAVEKFVEAWERETGLSREKLLFTSYRKVENDIGGRLEKEEKVSATVRAAELAGKVGGGW